jgi:hypothetical protein
MITKHRLLSHAAACGVADYLGDSSHENHVGKEITAEFFGCEKSTFSGALAEAISPNKKGGRPPKWAALEVILSPSSTDKLSEKEADYWVGEIVAAYSPKAYLIAKHEGQNKSDYHLLLVNKTIENRALQSIGDPSHRRKTIAVSDAVLRDLNRVREKENRPKINTMKEVRAAINKDKGILPLSLQIARLAVTIGLKSWLKILPKLAELIVNLGHEVTRENEDFISVKFKDRKKSKRYKLVNLRGEIEKEMLPSRHNFSFAQPIKLASGTGKKMPQSSVWIEGHSAFAAAPAAPPAMASKAKSEDKGRDK